MGLILELVSSGAEQPPSVTRKSFGAAGGTIGRAKHSDWVLPNNKVSARHARITFEQSVYYIEDTSTNGVYVNSSEERLEPGRLYPLHNGDRLLIEPYEVLVSIVTERDETRRRPLTPAPAPVPGLGLGDPFSFDDPFAPAPPAPLPSFPVAPPAASIFEALGEPHPDDELDPLKLLDPGPAVPGARSAPAARDLEGLSPFEAHFQPPAVITPAPPAVSPPAAASPVLIPPDDYDPLAPDTGFRPAPVMDAPADLNDPFANLPRAPVEPPAVERPAPAPPSAPQPLVPPVPAAPVAGNLPPAAVHEAREARPRTPRAEARAGRPPVTGDLAGVLAAAGLHDVSVTPELAEQFGEILRVVVVGVMDVLRSRQEVKDEFRMKMTYFRPVDNNPLKFSANVDDALHNLLVKRNEAFLGPVEAFEDAFDDLRNHQLAMLAGMRVAFESTLAEFDPDRLQGQFDKQAGGNALFAMAGKMRYWDLFRTHREEIMRDPEATFRRLFGDAFTRAYEEQLKRLRERQGRG